MDKKKKETRSTPAEALAKAFKIKKDMDVKPSP